MAVTSTKGVVSLCNQADGSAMYSLQALWTQAREQLHVITIICANRTYAILKVRTVNNSLLSVYQIVDRVDSKLAALLVLPTLDT